MSRRSEGGAPAAQSSSGVLLNSLNVADAERVLIERALEAAGGNRTRAAEMLGISVRTLRNKLNSPGGADGATEGVIEGDSAP